jgi:hypothetical protein
MRRQFMYGPDGTFDAGVLELAEISTAPMPVAEANEVVGGWIDRFPQIAAGIEVPIQYVMAEHDGLWVVDEATVSAFADRFTSAPLVERAIFRGAGHNLDHHLLGEAFQFEQLAFALRSTRPDGRDRPS